MERPSRDAFATRFDTYVSELREVFASHGLRFGRPQDVASVAQALSAPGAVQEDASAVVRSVLYREHEGLSRAELTSVVVVAAGGADLYASAQEGDAIALLDAFVSGVRAGMRAGAPAERESRDTPVPDGVEPQMPAATETPLRREEVLAEQDTNETQELVVARSDRASMLAGVYAQAQKMAEGGGDGTYFLKAIADKEVETAPEENEVQTLEVRASRAYWGWIAGLCVLAALLAVGLVWRHRSAGTEEAVASGMQPARGAVGGSQAAAAAGTPMPGADVTGQSGSSVAGSGAAGTGGRRVDGPGGGGPGVGPGTQRQDSPGSLNGSQGINRDGGTAMRPAPLNSASSPVPPATTSPEKATGPAIKPVPDAIPVAKPKTTPAPATPAATGAPTATAVPASLGKYVVSSGVMSGHLVTAPAPPYPKMAKMWGVEGQVILQAVISSKGKVVSAHVLDGHKMLRGSAIKAVRSWRYRPYLVDGRPTDVATVVIVEYKLKP